MRFRGRAAMRGGAEDKGKPRLCWGASSRSLCAPGPSQVPGLGTIRTYGVGGLSTLGLLALLGVRVHWPEFWGSGYCSPVVNASAVMGVGGRVESELTKGTLSDPTLNFAPTAKVGSSEACRTSA